MPVIKYLVAAKCCSKWFTCMTMKTFNPHNNPIRFLINNYYYYHLLIDEKIEAQKQYIKARRARKWKG